MKDNDEYSPARIVVIGASAGGVNSVIGLCAQLASEMDIAVCVVVHLSQLSISEMLVNRIQRSTGFICKLPADEEVIERGHVYLAPADCHLLVKKNKILLGHGAAESRWRPSIDVLFRSAAAAYGDRAIGVILSGLMQDGTAGMMAIKRSGGLTIVQDPDEAEYPDMPLSVINSMEVDFCVGVSTMGDILLEKTIAYKKNGISQIPADVIKEADIAERVAIGIDNVKALGENSLYSCPDCGGGLWEIKEGGLTRYRCHVGHTFTENELDDSQDKALEGTLWTALRMMEERRNLLTRLIGEEKGKGWKRAAADKEARLQEVQQHIQVLKSVLLDK